MVVERLNLSYTTESGETARNPSARELRTRIEALASGSGNAYIICTRVPDREGSFAQSLANPDGTFELEAATDGPPTQLGTVVATAAEVVAAIEGWSRDDPDWRSVHVWKPVYPPLEPLDPELAAKAAEFARGCVATGYATRDDAVQSVYESFSGAGGVHRVDERHAEELVDAAWSGQLARQESWPETTDVDRLHQAFAALDAAGVTARAHFACCRNCGLSEIWAQAGPGQHGFVFFHYQSTGHAVAGQGLSLYYGVLRRDPDGAKEADGAGSSGSSGSAGDTAGAGAMDGAAASVATLQVGREVAAALREAGLSVVWNEDPDRAIEVNPIAWLNRLPADAPQ